MKITNFEIENVKRVRAVAYEPSPNGLTIIGGDNRQGKTSILDAIAWALGGAKYSPANPQNDNSVLPPHIKITLNNGLVVERKGKNSELTVTDPSGARAGQKLLDSFISSFALDLPKFMEASEKEKSEILLKIIGVGDKLAELDREADALFNRRRVQGQIASQKRKYANELPEYPDAPDQPVSASELINRNAAILARNGENQRKRDTLAAMMKQRDAAMQNLRAIEMQLDALKAQREKMYQDYCTLLENIEIGKKTVEELVDETTDAIQAQLHDIDAINTKVRANAEKERADMEASAMEEEYKALTDQLEDVRKKRKALLDGAAFPLPGLSVEDGILVYQGHKWADISGSERLIISAAISKAINPQCEFVLMDKLEQMDLKTLETFNAWLKQQGLQVIATRVSTGSECQIIIEDGLIKKEPEPVTPATGMTWDWK